MFVAARNIAAAERLALTAEEAAHLRAWAAALRSGQYVQHRGAMQSDDGTAQCCLGVERLLAGCQVFTAYWTPPGDTEQYREQHIPGRLNWLPTWLPWPFLNPTSYPVVVFTDGETLPDVRFSWLNDHVKLTFPQIADVIDFLVDYAEVRDAV